MAARKVIRSLTDMIADVAYRKSRAAQARFAGAVPGAESPREVYLAACASIGSYLEDTFGFKYAKSGPHARRRSGDFAFEVRFQSSHNNIAGEHIVLWIHGNVWSSRIQKWREQQPHLHSSDYVAGGQLGNLVADHSWLEWELAEPRSRDGTIRDAIWAIEELALPYFAKFEDLPSLIKSLVKEELPCMSIDRAIEFLICFADRPQARSCAASFLETHRDLVDDYQRIYQQYAREGIELRGTSGYAEQLAYASHVYKLGDLTLGSSSVDAEM